MTLTEFYVWLEKQPIGDKLVYIRFKYHWERIWEYSNEILRVDMDYPTLYVWLNDWHSEYQDVDGLGCIDMDMIDVPKFNEQ